MMTTERGSWIIFAGISTWFGPYLEQEEADEARERLARVGDSLGMKWARKKTRVAFCSLQRGKKGHLQWEET